MSDFKAMEFIADKFRYLDQTKLPIIESYIETDDYKRIARSIETLEIRGAPAIGIAAAYAVFLGVKCMDKITDEHFNSIIDRLTATRPTAVNLFWALNRMKSVYLNNKSSPNLIESLYDEAKNIHIEDIEMCKQIGINGLEIFDKKSTVLTHCNTGKLATGGDGTALNIIINAYKKGLVDYVYADETRPLLQGSRLTAFELHKAGVPFSINTDSTAAVLMKEKKIDSVIVGSDRIALNGDAANKIGTYNLAVLCAYHNIPFYIAAPTSTIDRNCPSGENIIIEFRNKEELSLINGNIISSPDYNAYTPAFDVTPHELISGIVTEIALHRSPYDFSNI